MLLRSPEPNRSAKGQSSKVLHVSCILSCGVWGFARHELAGSPPQAPLASNCNAVVQAAMKILWESCIQPAAFPRAQEACMAVLCRVNDKEESIQELVTKIFHGLWFSSAQGGPAEVQQRAAQLAMVCAAVYKHSGSAIHLPLPKANPVVQVPPPLHARLPDRWCGAHELALADAWSLPCNARQINGGQAASQSTAP